MIRLAPGRLSTTICRPHISDSFAAIVRTTMSPAAPAVAGTTKRTERLGKSGPPAQFDNAAHSAAAQTAATMRSGSLACSSVRSISRCIAPPLSGCRQWHRLNASLVFPRPSLRGKPRLRPQPLELCAHKSKSGQFKDCKTATTICARDARKRKNMKEKLRLGVLGFGEVGYYYAREFRKAGVDDVVAYNNGSTHRPPYTREYMKQAEDIGVTLVGTIRELAQGADIVLSVVTPKGALPAALAAAPFLRAPVIYADLNSCSPRDKKAAAAAEEFQEKLGKYGTNVELVDGEVGTPAAMKLLSAILIKGTQSLVFQAVYAS